MSDQVWKYSSAEEYMDNDLYCSGEAVSERVGFEKANEIRDRLRKEDPDHCYFIRHFGAVAVIDSPYPFDRSIHDSD